MAGLDSAKFHSRRPVKTNLNGQPGIDGLAWHSVIHAEDPDQFRSTVTLAVYPSLTLTRIQQTVSGVERTQEMVDRLKIGTIVVFLQSGRVSVEQGRNRLTLTAGDTMVLSGHHAYYYNVESISDLTMVLMSRNSLAAYGLTDYAAGVREIPRSTLSRATHRFVASLTDELPEPESALGSASENALQTMLAGILLSAPETREIAGNVEVSRVVEVLDYVNSHSRDPELSPASTAVALNMSLRQVQRTLTNSGRTFSEELRERRVRDAVGQLRDPQWISMPLTVIASTVGFKTPKRMRKAFLEVHNKTPNEYRGTMPNVSNRGVGREPVRQ